MRCIYLVGRCEPFFHRGPLVWKVGHWLSRLGVVREFLRVYVLSDLQTKAVCVVNCDKGLAGVAGLNECQCRVVRELYEF